MPNVNRIISPYIVSGNPDTVNVKLDSPPGSAPGQPYAPGDIGASFDTNNRTYTVAIMDSGATSANTVGAPAVNQVLFWKNRNAGIVTNDFRQCSNPTVPANQVAGILRVTPGALGTYGSLICMLTRGYGITVAAGTCAIGVTVMANQSADKAEAVTATGTLNTLGVAVTADANSVITCNVDIPTLP